MTLRCNPRERQSTVPSGGWQIIYTGFILIMLCFFILLTSFASVEPSKITRFVSSFSNAVNVLEGGRSLEHSALILESEVNLLPKQNPVGSLFEQVQRISREEGLDHVGLHPSREGVVMTLSDRLFFDSAQVDLSPDAYPFLEKIVRLIERIPVPVEIRGYTDDLPIRTDRFPSNWELSTARAVSVLRFLIERHGVDPKRLSAVGFAQYQPVVPNDSPAQRAMNRRVELVFMVGQ